MTQVLFSVCHFLTFFFPFFTNFSFLSSHRLVSYPSSASPQHPFSSFPLAISLSLSLFLLLSHTFIFFFFGHLALTSLLSPPHPFSYLPLVISFLFLFFLSSTFSSLLFAISFPLPLSRLLDTYYLLSPHLFPFPLSPLLSILSALFP